MYFLYDQLFFVCDTVLRNNFSTILITFVYNYKTASNKMKSLGSLRLKAYNEDEVRRYRSIEERFVCSICADIKTTVDDLKLHYINVHGYKSPIQPLPVTSSPSAERDFFNESSESTTSSQAESIPKQSYYSEKVCSICRMVLKNSKTLSKHIKFVHNKIKSFQCSVCSKQFSRKATLEVSKTTFSERFYFKY